MGDALVFWSEIVDCQDFDKVFDLFECLKQISAMEGDSYPPPSEMEVGNVAPETMPVKSMVDYSDSNSADVRHQDQDHHGGQRQDEMDHQDTPSFSNGNGNGADEEQSKEINDDDAPPPEEKTDSFDLFGSMLSKMPAKSEEESEDKKEEKKEDDEKNEDGEKDTFDKMFGSEKKDEDKKDAFESDNKPSEENEEKKDDDDDQEDTKPADDGGHDFSANKFGEENISEAFKTLEVYQKALETERARVKKTIEEGMSPDTAVSITRKLRKLYAVTQKNMDLLDRAIVESFVENFPTESTRIHMGRVAPAQPAPAPARRGAAKSKKKIKKGLKVKPRGKAKPAKGKGKGKGRSIELNGAPEYVEYDLPASAKKKRKGYHDESDVELIDVSEDDEYYNPKKRSRPGPASSKKSKPGPASKKRSSYY